MIAKEKRDLIAELTETIDTLRWSDWERDFIESIRGRDMNFLSAKQQDKVFQLVERMDELQ